METGTVGEYSPYYGNKYVLYILLKYVFLLTYLSKIYHIANQNIW